MASLRKVDEGMPRRLIEGLFGAYGYLKRVVVVDDDIDIRDPAQVEWAQATRVGRPEQITVENGLGSRIDASRDPSDDSPGHPRERRDGYDARARPTAFWTARLVRTRPRWAR